MAAETVLSQTLEPHNPAANSGSDPHVRLVTTIAHVFFSDAIEHYKKHSLHHPTHLKDVALWMNELGMMVDVPYRELLERLKACVERQVFAVKEAKRRTVKPRAEHRSDGIIVYYPTPSTARVQRNSKIGQVIALCTRPEGASWSEIKPLVRCKPDYLFKTWLAKEKGLRTEFDGERYRIDPDTVEWRG